MITRKFQKDDAASQARYSDCERYRYDLTRVWAPEGGRRLLYVMLNPSKATEVANDPTIERCERRARALGGFGGFRATNIFAWRETDPSLLKKAAAPVGPDNDAVLLEGGAAWADEVLCAWGGAHGDHLERGRAVEALLRGTGQPLVQLGGLTKAGHPRHPLYIATPPVPNPGSERARRNRGGLPPVSALTGLIPLGVARPAGGSEAGGAGCAS